MDKQTKFDQRYLEMARIWAKNSYCTRRQVGALVVKNNMIISDGYNGTPSGFENVCEDDNGVTKPYVPALSAPSSSSSLASSAWSMVRNTVSWMASNYWSAQASK